MRKKQLLFFGVVMAVLVVAAGSAYAFSAADTGLQTTAQTAGLTKFGKDLPTIIGNVIGTGLSFVSVLFFLLMLYGGILWMTARGNEEQTKKALNALIAATVGLVIVLASYALTNFVFESVGSSGGGGGAPTGGPMGPPAPESESEPEPGDNAACLELGGDYDCRNIDNCGITQLEQWPPAGCEVDAIMDAEPGCELTIERQRSICGELDGCELNKCLGADDRVVCCTEGVGGPNINVTACQLCCERIAHSNDNDQYRQCVAGEGDYNGGPLDLCNVQCQRELDDDPNACVNCCIPLCGDFGDPNEFNRCVVACSMGSSIGDHDFIGPSDRCGLQCPNLRNDVNARMGACIDCCGSFCGDSMDIPGCLELCQFGNSNADHDFTGPSDHCVGLCPDFR